MNCIKGWNNTGNFGLGVRLLPKKGGEVCAKTLDRRQELKWPMPDFHAKCSQMNQCLSHNLHKLCSNCWSLMESSFYEGMTFLAQIFLFYTDGHNEDKIMFLKFLNLKVVNFFWREMFLIFFNLKVATLLLLSAPPPFPPPPKGGIILNVARVSRGYWCGLKKEPLRVYNICHILWEFIKVV